MEKQKNISENILFSVVMILIAVFIATSFTSCADDKSEPVEITQMKDSIKTLAPDVDVEITPIDESVSYLEASKLRIDSMLYIVLYTSSGGEVKVINISDKNE